MRRERHAVDGLEQDRLGPRASDAVLVRSYDHRRAYDLDVAVASTTGERVFRERFYLLPGHTERVPSVGPTGEYTVRVVLDNDRERETDCELGGSPERTLVIEVGNGSVSLTDGVHASV